MNAVRRLGDVVLDPTPADAARRRRGVCGSTLHGLDATLPLNSGRTTALSRREREG